MSTTEERFQAMQARDRVRMTLTELRELHSLLEQTTSLVAEAIKYERACAKHPVALANEERAEATLDAANLYLTRVRMRS